MTERDEILRRQRVRQLFEARIAHRSEAEVANFWGWLLQYHPELLPRKAGDQYLHLVADLKGLFQPD